MHDPTCINKCRKINIKIKFLVKFFSMISRLCPTLFFVGMWKYALHQVHHLYLNFVCIQLFRKAVSVLIPWEDDGLFCLSGRTSRFAEFFTYIVLLVKSSDLFELR